MTYSPDQVPEPEIGEESCPVCGEPVECDEEEHRFYDFTGTMRFMRRLVDLADRRRETHNSGEGAPF